MDSLCIHEVNLEETLALSKALEDILNERVIIECEPKDVNSLRAELTDMVKEAVPKIIEMVLRELNIHQPLHHRLPSQQARYLDT